MTIKTKIIILLSFLFFLTSNRSDAQVLKVASRVWRNIAKNVKFKSPQKALKTIKLPTKSPTKKGGTATKNIHIYPNLDISVVNETVNTTNNFVSINNIHKQVKYTTDIEDSYSDENYYYQITDHSTSLLGGFYQAGYYNDYYGNLYSVYAFAAQNMTDDILHFSFYAVNHYLNQQIGYVVTLQPGESFTYGSNVFWLWTLGERAYIVFNDGQTFFWQL